MIGTRNRLSDWIEGKAISLALALGIACLVSLTVLNNLMGIAPALRALFILPIWFGTRIGGRISGFILVAFATLANVWLDLEQGSSGITTVSSGLIWLGVLSIVMILVAKVEDSLRFTQRLANQDPLTGLFNRRGLEVEGRKAIEEGNGLPGKTMVVMVDCDRFKQVNDDHGHTAGDEALRFLAQTLRDHTRGSDVLARLGGDEFILVLPNTDESEAHSIMRRVERAFERGMKEIGCDVSLSLGFAGTSPEATTLRTLVAKADSAMYTSKLQKQVQGMAG